MPKSVFGMISVIAAMCFVCVSAADLSRNQSTSKYSFKAMHKGRVRQGAIFFDTIKGAYRFYDVTVDGSTVGRLFLSEASNGRTVNYMYDNISGSDQNIELKYKAFGSGGGDRVLKITVESGFASSGTLGLQTDQVGIGTVKVNVDGK